MRQGRCFLHEHAQSTSSWKLPEWEKLAANRMVFETISYTCRFGMVATREAGEGLVKKPTSMMTSSVEIHREINRQCDGSRRRVQLMGGNANHAAIYPKMLCRADCKATAWQMQADTLDLVSLKCEVSEVLTIDDVQVDEQDREDLNRLRFGDETKARY